MRCHDTRQIEEDAADDLALFTDMAARAAQDPELRVRLAGYMRIAPEAFDRILKRALEEVAALLGPKCRACRALLPGRTDGRGDNWSTRCAGGCSHPWHDFCPVCGDLAV